MGFWFSLGIPRTGTQSRRKLRGSSAQAQWILPRLPPFRQASEQRSRSFQASNYGRRRLTAATTTPTKTTTTATAAAAATTTTTTTVQNAGIQQHMLSLRPCCTHTSTTHTHTPNIINVYTHKRTLCLDLSAQARATSTLDVAQTLGITVLQN